MSSGGARGRMGGEIVTIQCGAAANWIGTQYHLLQNSNCDINSSFARSSHFRRGDSSASSASRGIVGEVDATVWMPRVVAVDASVGLDGIVATFTQQRDGDVQEELIQQYSSKAKIAKAQEAKAEAASSSGSKSGGSKRPQHWADLAKGVMPFHQKSLYSVPGLYEGTSDFHLHEQGKELAEREAIHEDVVDRVRWFLEECDQPDGIHLIVDANSGWSGFGSGLLGLLRDEYEKIPIFCVSSLFPLAPASSLGHSFASRTTVVQSVLNSSLLLQTASQLATAYLPLTTHYWATSTLARQALPSAHAAIQRGEIYESATMMAWIMHLTTAEYRLTQRSVNLATWMAGVTQQSSANVLSAKLLTQLQLEEQQEQATAAFRETNSSSSTASTPVLHTLPTSFPLSLLGHDVGFPAPVPDESHDEGQNSPPPCGANAALTESVHVFGRTEEMSHQQLVTKMERQHPAMFRYGTTRMNLPPSFPLSYYDLLNDGHVLSTYRCQTVGRELAHLGTWLSQLNRGAVSASHYTATAAADARARLPVILAHMQTQRQRNAVESLDEDGDRARGAASEHLSMTQWTQDELDEFVECGTTLQNLAETY